MNETPIKDDLSLKHVFSQIAMSESTSIYIREIAKLLVNNTISKSKIQEILLQYSISSIRTIKNELLDMLIAYSNLILEDGIITDTERRNFEFLKLYFEIKENDFYIEKQPEIKAILDKEFEKLYADNFITQSEAETNVILQDMFDLNYNQFDKLKEDFVKKSIRQGADITDLDTANINALKEKDS